MYLCLVASVLGSVLCSLDPQSVRRDELSGVVVLGVLTDVAPHPEPWLPHPLLLPAISWPVERKERLGLGKRGKDILTTLA